MTSFLILFFAFVLILGAFLLLIVFKRFDRNKIIIKSDELIKIQERWCDLERMLKIGGPGNYKQAIIEADKLLDLVLRFWVSGNSTGERLRRAKNLFNPSVYNEVWLAHKIRNKIAHESDFEILDSGAKKTIKKFEKALKELKALR